MRTTMKRTQRRAAALPVAVLALAAAAPEAAAADHVCEAVEPGTVTVDAMLDDWRGLAPVRRGQGSADASFELRCAFDTERLTIALRVRDERIIRSGRSGSGSPAEDALQLSLRAGSSLPAWTMTFHPGTRGRPARRVGGDGARADDSLIDDGWQIEVGVPLARIPGWGPSTPLLVGEVSYADVDRPGGEVETRLVFAGSLHFSTHLPALRGFLSAARTSVRELRLDVLAEMDGTPGTERVVAGGRMLGVLTDSFTFIELPLTSPDDLERAMVIDFDDDGRSSLLTQHRQHGGGGSREVVTVWSVGASGQLERVLAFETMLELGGRKLVNRWTLVPARGQRARHGRAGKPGPVQRTAQPRADQPRPPPGQGGKLDILVEVRPEDNIGWDAQSFARVTPSPDVRPILTPWAGKRAVIYYFDGEVALEAAARPAR